MEVLEASIGSSIDILGISSSSTIFDFRVLLRIISPGIAIVGFGLRYIGSSSISPILLGLLGPISGDSKSDGYT